MFVRNVTDMRNLVATNVITSMVCDAVIVKDLAISTQLSILQGNKNNQQHDYRRISNGKAYDSELSKISR